MSNVSSGVDDDIQDHDLESQLVDDNGGTPIRDHWRWIYLILHARQLLISRSALASNKATPLPPLSSSTLSFSLIATSDPANHGTVELTQAGEVILPPSPQVSLDVHSDGNNDDRSLQHATIAKIVKSKNSASLHEFGNVQGLAEALNTDLEDGITGDFGCRHSSTCSFSTTREAPGKQRTFFPFLFNDSNRYIIFLLFVCAVLSIGFGIKEEGPDTGWYEGVFIVFAIIILVAVATARDIWYSQNKLLARGRKVAVVDVVREGCQQQIDISDVVMGDIVCLTADRCVPGDGLFICGQHLKVVVDHELVETSVDKQNPFLSYGAKVVSGNGRMLVTSVGEDTAWGEMMSTFTNTPPHKKTPLQIQIDRVNCCIQIIGLLITVFILIVLFLRFNLEKENGASAFPDLKRKPTALREFLAAIRKISMKPRGKVSVVTSLVMFLVGMTEGVPFIASLAIAYWNKKVMSCNDTARDLLAIVAMGSVTAICTDISSEVISNKMEVEMLNIGEELISVDSKIASGVLEPLHHGICTPALKQPNAINSKEDAIMSWFSRQWGMNAEIIKKNCEIVNSSEDGCGVLMRINRKGEDSMSFHRKGPAKTILTMCSHYYDIRGEKMTFDEHKRISFQHLVEDMQGKNLETIAYAYKQTEVKLFQENGLTLLGILGLKHSCREEIEACMKAGVRIILVSGEKVPVVESLALDCGMVMPNSSAAVLGEVFRESTHEEKINISDQICIMGESLPTDRLLLVKCLREKGHIVAVVGVRTDEASALKEADVGITVGSRSTEMAKESSDIIISSPNGNFSFLVTIMRLGQCAVENIKKLIQVELTMTIAWCLINLIMIVCFGDSQITSIQWLWVYLILAIICGLPLLTDPPTQQQTLTRRPLASQIGPLVTWTMWRNIITQALYQTAVLVTFQFRGQAIININHKVSETMIFNSFVLCQVFNQFNARELERMNVFGGIRADLWLWVAVGVTAILQVAFIEIAHIVGGSARLSGKQYAICLLIGLVSWPMDLAVKCISQVFMRLLTRPTGMTASDSSESLIINLESPLIPVNPL